MTTMSYMTYPKRPTFRDIQWPVPGSRSWCSADDGAIRAAEALSHGWDHARGPCDKLPLLLRTIANVSHEKAMELW